MRRAAFSKENTKIRSPEARCHDVVAGMNARDLTINFVNRQGAGSGCLQRGAGTGRSASEVHGTTVDLLLHKRTVWPLCHDDIYVL